LLVPLPRYSCTEKAQTTSFPHRILANVPNFRDLVERRMVGTREGYILSADGVFRLLQILAEVTSKTPENQAALDTFRHWCIQTLIPELAHRTQPCPGKIRICADGVDLRLDLADLARVGRTPVADAALPGVRADGLQGLQVLALRERGDLRLRRPPGRSRRGEQVLAFRIHCSDEVRVDVSGPFGLGASKGQR
jgi:hypothetical protein